MKGDQVADAQTQPDSTLEVVSPPTSTQTATSADKGNPRVGRGPQPRRNLPMASARCTAVTAANRPCTAPKMTGRVRCAFHEGKHDPELAARQRASRQLGGRVARVVGGVDIGAVDFASPEGVRTVLERVAENVVSNKLTSSQAAAVAQLANSALRVAELMLTVKLKELEARLEGNAS